MERAAASRAERCGRRRACGSRAGGGRAAARAERAAARAGGVAGGAGGQRARAAALGSGARVVLRAETYRRFNRR